jgi:hypothetical protein
MAAWDPRANQLFREALELASAEQRQSYLDRACGPDTTKSAPAEKQ